MSLSNLEYSMTLDQKRNTILVVLGITILMFIFLVISPLFNQIQQEQENLISQKNKLAELELKIANLKNFQKTSKLFQANLEKINELFIDSAEPVDFIEFLEKEAQGQQLSIAILPLPREEGKPWPSMNFRLTILGSPPAFLRFLERLETGPYLLEILNLDLRKNKEFPNNIDATLLVKTYAK